MAIETTSRMLAVTVLVFSWPLAGCATDDGSFLQPGASRAAAQAVETTLAAQIINPDPQYDGPMQGQGVQAEGAYDRYVKGNVKAPERVKTSSVVGSSGGSN